jgi:hypothetical protein
MIRKFYSSQKKKIGQILMKYYNFMLQFFMGSQFNNNKRHWVNDKTKDKSMKKNKIAF